ncbi:hypothetical protein PC123_g21975 [Phytophthora cactorum]|nr:hypothetical protein PC123_g21975 [Phytophthora cactorum]
MGETLDTTQTCWLISMSHVATWTRIMGYGMGYKRAIGTAGHHFMCRLAAKRTVRSWQHHRRDDNKTADTLANAVMDASINYQVSPQLSMEIRDKWRDVLAHIANDVGHWLATCRNIHEDSPETVVDAV